MLRQSARLARAKKHGVKAWLVTWEWGGEHAKREEKIAAILDPRLSAHRVRDLVEFLYINSTGIYTLSERLDFASRKSRNPYRARLSKGSVIDCGSNPFLLARLVDDLVIEYDEHHSESAKWTNRPLPDLSWMHQQQ